MTSFDPERKAHPVSYFAPRHGSETRVSVIGFCQNIQGIVCRINGKEMVWTFGNTISKQILEVAERFDLAVYDLLVHRDKLQFNIVAIEKEAP